MLSLYSVDIIVTWGIVVKRLFSLVMILLFSSVFMLSAQTQEEASTSTIAWAIANQVFVWDADSNAARELDTFAESATVQRINLSPDGTRLAIVWATIGDDGYTPENHQLNIATLNPDDGFSNERVINFNDLYPDNDSETVISQYDWADNTTIYFSSGIASQVYSRPNNDLWRMNIDTGDITSIVPPRVSGNFVVNPYDDSVIMMTAGDYNDEIDGTIVLMEADGQSRQLLSFPTVATASEYYFYPQINWLDEQTIWMAIPDRDSIYQMGEEDAPPISLWQLDFESGDSEIIGEVNADFFGVPALSPDGTAISYLQRTDFNEFSLYVADVNGENEELIQTDVMSRGHWLNGLNSLLFYTDEGAFIQPIGELAQPLRGQTDPRYNVLRVYSNANGDIVFVGYYGEPVGGTFELRHTHIDSLSEEAQLLVATTSNIGFFNVSLVGD